MFDDFDPSFWSPYGGQYITMAERTLVNHLNTTLTRDAVEYAIPSGLASIVSSLSGNTLLVDMIILSVAHWIIQFFGKLARRMSFQRVKFMDWIHYMFMNWLYFQVTITDKEESQKWLMFWLSKKPDFADVRHIQFGHKLRDFNGVNVNSLGPHGPVDPTISALAYVPLHRFQYSFWMKWHYITIYQDALQIDRDEDGTGYGTSTSSNQILIRFIAPWFHSRAIILDLIEEARKMYVSNAALIQETHIYTMRKSFEISYRSDSAWKKSSTISKRSFESIILDPAVKDLVLDDARSFLNDKKWYTTRNIPYRRGYLLYGEPGAGKSSFISAIAGELNLDVYMISLSAPDMDDMSLVRIFNKLPEHCIALLEDIDAAFTTSLNRDQQDDGVSMFRRSDRRSGVSLSGLLNALDGIGAQEGRILFATTNKYDSLDAALTRPGRMDIHIEFKLAAKYQARDLFRRFFDPAFDEEESGGEIKDEPSRPPTPPPTPPTASSSNLSTPASRASISPAPEVKFVGQLHTHRAPRLSKAEVDELSETFADAIPAFEISMATLQGYLMMHKTAPFAAVAYAKAWADDLVLTARLHREETEREALQREVHKKQARDAMSSYFFAPPAMMSPYAAWSNQSSGYVSDSDSD